MKPDLKNYLNSVDGILISSMSNIIYLTNYSAFSETERECFLLITKRKKYLITDGRYSEAIKKRVKGFELIPAGAGVFIQKLSKKFFKKLGIKKIGFEENNLFFSEYKILSKTVKLKPIDLASLRSIKTKNEIKNIREACKIGDLAFNYICKELKKGVTEREIAQKLEFFIKKKGADISFKPIVAFGKHSSIPHHQTGKNKLKKNQIVLLDFGVKINNYCSDMSRTVFFGKAPAKFKRMHQTVLDAQQKAIQYINRSYSSSKRSESRSRFSTSSNNNLLARSIDKIARDYIKSQGYPDIIHSVGHGIGIEVHEAPHLSPKSKDRIKPGMVFSVEPGIYITDYGGVRIEDLVAVGKSGAELISHSNREIIEV